MRVLPQRRATRTRPDIFFRGTAIASPGVPGSASPHPESRSHSRTQATAYTVTVGRAIRGCLRWADSPARRRCRNLPTDFSPGAPRHMKSTSMERTCGRRIRARFRRRRRSPTGQMRLAMPIRLRPHDSVRCQEQRRPHGHCRHGQLSEFEYAQRMALYSLRRGLIRIALRFRGHQPRTAAPPPRRTPARSRTRNAAVREKTHPSWPGVKLASLMTPS